MTGLEELRQRVAQAEERFGVIDERHAKYSGRLITLMNAIEGRIREQRAEIEQQSGEILRQGRDNAELSARLSRVDEENEQLRAMLHSLLKAIEGGQRDVLAETMLSLDSTVSALMRGSAQEATLLEAPLDSAPAMAAPGAADDDAFGAASPTLEERDAGDPFDRGVGHGAWDAALPDDTAPWSTRETAPEAPEAPEAPDFAGACVAEPQPSAEPDRPHTIDVRDDARFETISDAETDQPRTLNEIMRRVSRLVEAADAAGLPARAGSAASDSDGPEVETDGPGKRTAASS